MIEVIVTATNYQVSASEITNPVTVTSDNVLFTVTSVVNNFTVTNVTPQFTFSTEGAGFDFAAKHVGEWVSGTQYARNDVVRYQYSIYICAIPNSDTLISTTPPPNAPAQWELFVFNEWPRAYLTVTNTLTVSGQVLASTGTFDNLAVSNQFAINGLKYPVSRGAYGQVLFTNGTSTAAWANLGDLVFWSLSSDLQTNGFNIVTGSDPAVPNPQLTIGSGEAGSFDSYLRFNQGGTSATLASPVLELKSTLGNAGVKITGANVGQNKVEVSGALIATNITSTNVVTQNLYVSGSVRGAPDGDPIFDVFKGIRFPDGTVMTSTVFTVITTSTSTGGSTGTISIPIASADSLGVIRVGSNLTINSSTGVLSAVIPPPPEPYTLPAASTSTRGGIRVGNGLMISNGDVLNVTTSTEFGNVSLTEDLLTNGYKLRYDEFTESYVDINSSTVAVKTGNSNVDIGDDKLWLRTSSATSYVNINGSDIEIKTANSKINLATNEVSLETLGTKARFSSTGIVATSTTIILDAQNPVEVRAPITVLGDDVSNSRLHVSRIYNFAGVGAPFFPAGVQFPDQTIQITAYDDGRFDNGDVSAPFAYRSWQQLITYLISIDFIDPNLVWSEPDLG